MRLIDADNLAAKIMMEAPDFMDGGSSITKAFILAMVRTSSITPTIDAVPVVRCEDCKHRTEEMYNYCNNPNDKRYVCQINDLAKKPDWYCADGKRREDDARPGEGYKAHHCGALHCKNV